MEDFDGIFAKMRLAQFHLKELEREFDRFQDAKLYTIKTEVDRDAGKKKAVFYPTEPIPLAWSAVLGEILYGLRSSLDHAVYILTKKHCPSALDMWTAFPVSETKGKFEGSGPKDKRAGRWKLRGIPKDAYDLIERIQPFKVESPHVARDTRLWVFDELANIDKHRTLNLYRATPYDIKGTPRGGSLVVKNFLWTMPLKLEDGTVIGVWEPAGELNDEVDMDIDIKFDITLDDVGPEQSHGHGVIATVQEFGTYVNQILTALREIHYRA